MFSCSNCHATVPSVSPPPLFFISHVTHTHTRARACTHTHTHKHSDTQQTNKNRCSDSDLCSLWCACIQQSSLNERSTLYGCTIFFGRAISFFIYTFFSSPVWLILALTCAIQPGMQRVLCGPCGLSVDMCMCTRALMLNSCFRFKVMKHDPLTLIMTRSLFFSSLSLSLSLKVFFSVSGVHPNLCALKEREVFCLPSMCQWSAMEQNSRLLSNDSSLSLSTISKKKKNLPPRNQ